jgi:serine beta-lactamase-like protein LACTB, mitochondrial
MTTFQPDYQWIDIPHSAVGYKKNAAGDYVKSTDTDVSWKLGGGGFISTVTDMALFGQGLLTGKLLDDATRAQMWTRQKTRDGIETGYGLGFSIHIENGQRRVEHSGAQEKAATHLLLLPDQNLVIAAMSNTEGVRLGALTHDLARIITPTPDNK